MKSGAAWAVALVLGQLGQLMEIIISCVNNVNSSRTYPHSPAFQWIILYNYSHWLLWLLQSLCLIKSPFQCIAFFIGFPHIPGFFTVEPFALGFPIRHLHKGADDEVSSVVPTLGAGSASRFPWETMQLWPWLSVITGYFNAHRIHVCYIW